MRIIFLFLVCFISLTTFAQTYLVSFSSNALSTSGGANKSDLNGADLYSVFYKPYINDSIYGLKRLTTFSNKAEVFPSISNDTNWIAYNYNQKTPWHNEVRLIKRATGVEYTTFNLGRFPQWINNNQLVLSDTADVYISRLSFSGGTPTVLGNKKVTNRSITTNISQCEDPYPFSNGTKILFHGYNSVTGSTALCQIDSNSINFLKLSSFSAYGHGIVASTNNDILASQANSSQPLRFATNTSTFSPIALNLPTSTTIMSAYDTRYGTAATIKWSFLSWGYNDRSFFVSCSGEDVSNVHFISRIFYVEYNSSWTSYTLHDFSKKIEQKLSVTGKDFISSSAIALSLIGTGVDEEKKEFSTLIYPNPTNSSISFNAKENDQISIYDLSGKLLLNKFSEEGLNTIDLNQFVNGLYIIKIGNKFSKISLHK